MLEEMVASVMKKTLAQDFPHLKLPAAVFATIDSAAKSDAFDIEELIVHNEVTGEVFKAHITSYWYEYKLTVIDRFGNPDANYPALPGIKSKKQFKAGAVVAVALPYGDLTPAIIGEVELYGPERYGHPAQQRVAAHTGHRRRRAALLGAGVSVSKHRP